MQTVETQQRRLSQDQEKGLSGKILAQNLAAFFPSPENTKESRFKGKELIRSAWKTPKQDSTPDEERSLLPSYPGMW